MFGLGVLGTSADVNIGRCMTTNSTNSDADYNYERPKHIPSPSWSIQDLELSSQHPPLPKEELERLSRLALIDVTSSSEEEQARLNQDLANMLHMIQQVTEYQHGDNEPTTYEEDLVRSCQIYDEVRGVMAAPLRKSLEADPLQEKDAQQAQDIWKILLKPKTIRKGGGHEYFAIATGDEEGTSS